MAIIHILYTIIMLSYDVRHGEIVIGPIGMDIENHHILVNIMLNDNNQLAEQGNTQIFNIVQKIHWYHSEIYTHVIKYMFLK